MKCTRCGKEAFEKFRGRYYCRDCFIERYEEAVKSTIKRYKMIRKGEKILAALSGGKDSVAMLSVLSNLSLQVEALHIDLGIGDYSRKSLEVSKKVSKVLGVELHVISLKSYGFTIEDVKRRECSVCGNAKRYLMNRFAREMGFNAIATGHCAEDILANFFKNLYSGNIEWSEKQKPRIEGFDKIVTRIRPLYEIGERENLLYVMARDLPFLYEECPKAPSTKWKEIVYDIERKIPNFKINCLRNLAREREEKKVDYRYCKVCGEITTAEVCQFCRNVMRFRSPRSR